MKDKGELVFLKARDACNKYKNFGKLQAKLVLGIGVNRVEQTNLNPVRSRARMRDLRRTSSSGARAESGWSAHICASNSAVGREQQCRSTDASTRR